jgi:hypothetical protein
MHAGLLNLAQKRRQRAKFDALAQAIARRHNPDMMEPFFETEQDLSDKEQERLTPDTDFEADNPDGAAASIKAAEELEFAPAIETELMDRAETIQTVDNDPDVPDTVEDDVYTSQERAFRALKASFSRGLGAGQSTRGVEEPTRWGYARTGDFGKTVKAGEPDDAEFVSDNDLLPLGHPLRSVEEPPEGMDDQPFVEGVPEGDKRESLEDFIETKI